MLKLISLLLLSISYRICAFQSPRGFRGSLRLTERLYRSEKWERQTTQRSNHLKRSSYSLASSIESSADVDESKLSNGLQYKIANGLISSVFAIKPLYNMIKTKARNMIIERGMQVGVDWYGNVAKLQDEIDYLEGCYKELKSDSLIYPSYYLKPFHAYDEGNLSWTAAMEVESAAVSVHSPIFTSSTKELDAKGDFMLRDNFHLKMKEAFSIRGFKPTKILDIGCSTGLSTMKLHESFPDTEIIGADLSPYMLAVASYNLKESVKETSRLPISYIHAAGELSTLGQGDVDLVSMCLVAHELPAEVTRDVFREAYKILPSGGAVSFMDMNPKSPFFKRFASNSFAFAAFKSTEPWIEAYVSLDLELTLHECGFSGVTVMENSPRHRTVVAYKL